MILELVAAVLFIVILFRLGYYALANIGWVVLLIIVYTVYDRGSYRPEERSVEALADVSQIVVRSSKGIVVDGITKGVEIVLHNGTKARLYDFYARCNYRFFDYADQTNRETTFYYMRYLRPGENRFEVGWNVFNRGIDPNSFVCTPFYQIEYSDLLRNRP